MRYIIVQNLKNKFYRSTLNFVVPHYKSAQSEKRLSFQISELNFTVPH